VTPLEPGRSPGFLLWRATMRWQRAIAAALKPLDLTHVQFVVLACSWWLERRDGPPNQMAVAAQAGTDIKMTSQVLRTLEGKGLLRRTVDPHDGRAKLIQVTPRGARLAPKVIAAVERVDADFFATAPMKDPIGLLTDLAGP
jgi:DNA-binding MarR family transcriptional regulator